MRRETNYKDVYYTLCDDVGENEGGYFVQFYSDSQYANEIDCMVLHANTDEVVNIDKYIKEHIVDEKLDSIVAREAIKNNIKDNSKLIEIVDLFMNENDKAGLKELYNVTEDKLVKTLLNWKNEYGDLVDDYTTYVGSMYEDIMQIVWNKYNLGKIKNKSEENIIEEDEEEIL